MTQLTTQSDIWQQCESCCPPVPLAVPEWGGKEILLRYTSAAEAEEISKLAKSNAPNLGGVIAVRVISDATGNRLFQNTDAPDMGRRLKNRVLQRIVQAAMRMNALEDEEGATTRQIEAELAEEAENPTA